MLVNASLAGGKNINFTVPRMLELLLLESLFLLN